MPKYYLNSLIVIATMCLSHSTAQAADKAFFQTTSAGFATTWSATDLQVKEIATNKIVFSAKSIAQREKPKKSAKTTVDRSFKLLSQVGPYLSYDDECTFDWPGMAHPGVGDVRFYHAVDLNKPSAKLSLTALFGDDAVYKALLANATIKKALKEKHGTPGNLNALIKAIQDDSVETKDADGNDAKLLFSADMLNHFCVNNSKANIDVAVSLYDQANNQISPLVLHMPIKYIGDPSWMPDADSQKHGTLAEKLSKQKPDAETDFHLDP